MSIVIGDIVNKDLEILQNQQYNIKYMTKEELIKYINDNINKEKIGVVVVNTDLFDIIRNNEYAIEFGDNIKLNITQYKNNIIKNNTKTGFIKYVENHRKKR